MVRTPVAPLRLNSDRFRYNFSVAGNFSDTEISLLSSTFDRFFEVVGNGLGDVLISRDMCFQLDSKGGNFFKSPSIVCLNTIKLTEWTIVHELGHALDASHGWQFSRRLSKVTGSRFPLKLLHKKFPQWRLFWYHVGSPPPPCGVNAKFNPVEDFAETVAAYIFPEKAKNKASTKGFTYENYGYHHFHETPRGKFFENLLSEFEPKTPS